MVMAWYTMQGVARMSLEHMIAFAVLRGLLGKAIRARISDLNFQWLDYLPCYTALDCVDVPCISKLQRCADETLSTLWHNPMRDVKGVLAEEMDHGDRDVWELVVLWLVLRRRISGEIVSPSALSLLLLRVRSSLEIIIVLGRCSVRGRFHACCATGLWV